MPTIIVKNAEVEERAINGKNGRQIIRSQTAALELGKGYALPFRVGLGQNSPYPPGEYDIDPRSFKLSPFGDLELSRYLDLVPIQHKPAPAAKA